MSGHNLRTVVVISRHAQRYPVTNIDGFEQLDSNLLGKITPHGIESMKNLGSVILDRYGAAFVENCKLILHHSEQKRCLTSLLTVAEALNKKPAAVFSNEDGDLYQRTLIWSDLSDALAESMIKCSNLINVEGVLKDPFLTAMNIDTVVCHANFEYVLPINLLDKIPLFTSTLLRFVTALRSLAKHNVAVKALQPITDAVERNQSEIVLISTSDVQLLILLDSLCQNPYKNRPEYGASIYFEVYDDGKIEIYFMEEPKSPFVRLKNCNVPLDKESFLLFMNNLCNEIQKTK